MENENKVALFDFCETLVNFQTADAFVDFVRSKENNKRMIFLEKIKKIHDGCRIANIVEYLLMGENSISKRLKLLQLRGFHKDRLLLYAKEYYESMIKKNNISLVVDQLKKLKEEYRVYLVSGGYDIYLQFFVEDFKLDGMISTKIQFENGICTGRFEGIDCMRNNKVLLLNNYFPCRPQNVIAFSDSKSDVPLLSWADKGVVVSKGKGQIWVGSYGFDELIW